jgi:hypothetical protein
MKFLAIAIKHLIEHGADPLAIQRFVDEMAREGGSLMPSTEQSGANAPDSYEAMFPSKAARHSFDYRQRKKLTKPDGTDENLTELTLKKEGSHTLQEKNNINIYTPTKAKKGSRLPENWQPSLETLSYADKLGCSAAEITSMAEDFRLWAYSASGQVSIKRDWESAFKGWMRREKAKKATQPHYQRGKPSTVTVGPWKPIEPEKMPEPISPAELAKRQEQIRKAKEALCKKP